MHCDQVFILQPDILDARQVQPLKLNWLFFHTCLLFLFIFFQRMSPSVLLSAWYFIYQKSHRWEKHNSQDPSRYAVGFLWLITKLPCPLLNISYSVAKSVIRSNIYWVFFQKSRSVLSAVCVPSHAVLLAARLWATAVQTFKFLLCCVTWVSTFLSHGTLREGI